MALAEPLPLVAVHPAPAERAVIWLRGEHDLATVSATAEDISRAIAFDEADLVVDLSGVTFLDASTINVLVKVREYLRIRDRSLEVRAPSACAARLLDLCSLSHLVGARPA